MAGTHSYWLILLSVIVATMASFVGLDLGGRLARFRHHGMRSLWLVAGALSIGMGVWTMHFIGMLGFHLPIAVSYDIWITLLSLVMAIAGCGASLALVSSASMGAGRLFGGGTLIGVAIVPLGDVPAAKEHKLIVETLDEAPRPTAVVRRYREAPPLVRDAAGKWRTGRLDLVLGGEFDLLQATER